MGGGGRPLLFAWAAQLAAGQAGPAFSSLAPSLATLNDHLQQQQQQQQQQEGARVSLPSALLQRLFPTPVVLNFSVTGVVR